MGYKNKLNNWANAAAASMIMSLLLGLVLLSASCGKNMGNENTPAGANTVPGGAAPVPGNDGGSDPAAIIEHNNKELQDALTALGGWENFEDSDKFIEIVDSKLNAGKLDTGLISSLRELVYKDGDYKQGSKESIKGALKEAVNACQLFKDFGYDNLTSSFQFYDNLTSSFQFIVCSLGLIKDLKDQVFKDGIDNVKAKTNFKALKEDFDKKMENGHYMVFISAHASAKIEQSSLNMAMSNEIKKAAKRMLEKVQGIYDTYIQALSNK